MEGQFEGRQSHPCRPFSSRVHRDLNGSLDWDVLSGILLVVVGNWACEDGRCVPDIGLTITHVRRLRRTLKRSRVSMVDVYDDETRKLERKTRRDGEAVSNHQLILTNSNPFNYLFLLCCLIVHAHSLPLLTCRFFSFETVTTNTASDPTYVSARGSTFEQHACGGGWSGRGMNAFLCRPRLLVVMAALLNSSSHARTRGVATQTHHQYHQTS